MTYVAVVKNEKNGWDVVMVRVLNGKTDKTLVHKGISQHHAAVTLGREYSLENNLHFVC